MNYVVGDISVSTHPHVYLSMTNPISLPFPHRSGHKGGIPATLWQSHKIERKEDMEETGEESKQLEGSEVRKFLYWNNKAQRETALFLSPPGKCMPCPT